jgi:hypothetical protein
MLLVAPVGPSTGAWAASNAALGAACGDRGCLLATDGRHVGCWAAAAPGEAPRCRWQQRIAGGGRVEFAALLPAADECLEAFLLVTSHGPTAPAQAAIVAVGGAGGGQTVLATAALVNDEHNGPPSRPTFSNLAPCGGSGGSVVLAASLQQGMVHLVQAERSGGTWCIAASSHKLCELLTTDPGA